MASLQGKHLVVIGGSSGIGLQVAQLTIFGRTAGRGAGRTNPPAFC